MAFCPEHPKKERVRDIQKTAVRETKNTAWVRPKSAISIYKRDDEYLRHFNMGIPPRKNTIPCLPNQFITWLST